MIKLFISKIKYYFTVIFLLTLQSCSSIEQHKPLEGITNSIILKNWDQEENNSLLQQDTSLLNYGYQALFSDHRPHKIGDTVTIVLQENISASNSSFSDISRDGNSNVGINIFPMELNSIFGFNLKDNVPKLDAAGKNNFYGKGSNSAKNTFTGLITATVQAVFPNGNLQVIGEKQVSINEGTEFIRFSGTINPHDINKNNVIISTQIANAHIEYFSRGYMNNTTKMGWFQRLLLKISPI